MYVVLILSFPQPRKGKFLDLQLIDFQRNFFQKKFNLHSISEFYRRSDRDRIDYRTFYISDITN